METESLQQDILTKKARYRAWGRFLVFAPLIGLAISVVAFACSTVVGMGDAYVVARIVRVIGGLVGTLSGIGFALVFPVGIILLGISNRLFAGAPDARSAQGAVALVPAEIRGWNWGGGWFGVVVGCEP